MIRVATTFAVLLALSPAEAAPVPRDAPPGAVYYPTTKGTRWVYQSEVRDDEEEVEIAAVETVDGEKIVSRAAKGPNTRVYGRMAVSLKGVRRVSGAGDGTAAGDWLVRVPFKAGEKWDSTESFSRRTFGPEKVVVPAGTFDAVRVEVEAVPTGEVVIFWFSAGVGEVKRSNRQPDGTTSVYRTLKSFTPGKD